METTQQISPEEVIPKDFVLTPKELAKFLKIGVNRAYELMNVDAFPSFRIGTRHRVRMDELLDWLKTDEAKELLASC